MYGKGIVILSAEAFLLSLRKGSTFIRSCLSDSLIEWTSGMKVAQNLLRQLLGQQGWQQTSRTVLDRLPLFSNQSSFFRSFFNIPFLLDAL